MSWIDPLDALPPPPPPSPPGPAPRWAKALAAGIALLVVAAVVVVVVRSTGGGARFDHPDEWDPRVADLAAFVEDARELDFAHPVHVDFLTAEEHRAEATADEADLTDEDRAALAQDAGLLRALGVASGPLDLLAAFNTVTDGGTLAFYDPDDGRIRVRGTELTAGLRVTLVHELTHALQDQAFDLRRLDGEELDSGEAAAFRALVEGDALRVEDEYVADVLTPAEREAYEQEHAGEVEASEAATAEVPPFLGATFAAPYLLGRPFVTMLLNQGGNAAVDEALTEPPATEEHLFDPSSYLADEEPTRLEIEVPDGAEPLDEAGPFGTPTWFLVLAERIDPMVAFEAALGWGGDGSIAFERDGTSCVRAVFTGDTEADGTEMSAALDAWADTMPAGVVERFELDGDPGFESCDPGEDVDLELTGRSADALVLPSLWGYLVADAATIADAAAARCYAARVIDGLTYDEIVDPEGAVFGRDDFQASLRDAFEACA